DVTWIDFSANWAHGLRQLMKKLDSIDTPMDAAVTRRRLADWHESASVLTRRPEQLRSNVVEFLEVPDIIYKLQASGEFALTWPDDWPRVEDGLAWWVFELPPATEGTIVSRPYRWTEDVIDPMVNLPGKASNLLRQYI